TRIGTTPSSAPPDRARQERINPHPSPKAASAAFFYACLRLPLNDRIFVAEPREPHPHHSVRRRGQAALAAVARPLSKAFHRAGQRRESAAKGAATGAGPARRR